MCTSFDVPPEGMGSAESGPAMGRTSRGSDGDDIPRLEGSGGEGVDFFQDSGSIPRLLKRRVMYFSDDQAKSDEGTLRQKIVIGR